MQVPDSPGWLGTARAESLVEEPERPDRSGVLPLRDAGINNRISVSCRESDRLIVATKSRNRDGAKGPDREHVEVNMKGEPLGHESHYGKKIS